MYVKNNKKKIEGHKIPSFLIKLDRERFLKLSRHRTVSLSKLLELGFLVRAKKVILKHFCPPY